MLYQDDLRELETKKDLELEDYRVEIIRLNAKLRQMSTEKSLSDIYNTFEEELKRFPSFVFRHPPPRGRI